MAKAANTAKTFIKDVIVFLFIFMVFTAFGYQSFHIPSGSMEPTLEVGDRVFVSKFSYGYSKYSLPFDPPVGQWRIFEDAPKRGDVAVFTDPKQNGGTDLIKRVIGLPGDRIQMIEGRLYINGDMVERTFVREVSYTNYRGMDYTVSEYDQTLPNGVTFRIYEHSDHDMLDETSLIVVPQGHYFMMGDNRDQSADSRSSLGPIPMEQMVGRAEVTTFSLYDCDQGKDISCTMGIPFGRFFKGL